MPRTLTDSTYKRCRNIELDSDRHYLLAAPVGISYRLALPVGYASKLAPQLSLPITRSICPFFEA